MTEVVASHLERANASPEALFERMRALGYQGRTLGTVRRGLRHHLDLRELDPDGIRGDVLWMHPENDPVR